MHATFATCGDELDILLDSPDVRLSRYWDRLERQLARYKRLTRPVPAPVPAVQDDSVRDTEGNERISPRLRPNELLDRADRRYDPARMSDEEREALLESELWNDCQPVTITIRLFHRVGWAIRDLLDDDSNPVPKVPEYVAYSRLPVSGESEGYKMPAPIVTPSRMGREPNYGVQGLAELSAFLAMLAKRFEPVPRDETREDRLREYAKRHPELCGS